MEYKEFFSPSTLAKLDKQSAENLKQMLGDKNLMQTIMSSQQLLGQIAKAEAPYKNKLEKLAVDIVKELYPIIDEEGITIDAKIVSMSDVNKSLDEIKINKPIDYQKLWDETYKEAIDKINRKGNPDINAWDKELLNIRKKIFKEKTGKSIDDINESISPESRRRIINAITQGAAVRGAFAFYLFKEHLDEIDPSLVDKYNEIMKNTFGVYDDENAIAMFLAMLAQGHKAAGGSSKVIINEIRINKPKPLNFYYEKSNELFPNEYYGYLKGGIINNKYGINAFYYPSENAFKVYEPNRFNDDAINYLSKFGELKNSVLIIPSDKVNIANEPINEQQENSKITIQARAINFPMLVHEIVKGLFELISLQGFKGSKEQNQAVVDKVDLLTNEPYDLKYGKFIFDALRDVALNNNAESKTIPYFFAEVYKLDDEEFIEFVENSILGKLTSEQERWAKITIREIEDDLKADSTGLDEIKK